MTSLDTGTYGAKVQSWRRANPRDLLKRLIEENPGVAKAELFKTFRDQIRGDDGEEFLDSIVEYWFANNYHSLIEHPAPQLAANKAEKQTKIAEIKEKIKTRVRQEAIFLLDTALPHGKTLRNSTFGECAKIGGALSKIASKGRPGQIVGNVLSDTQLRKLQGR